MNSHITGDSAAITRSERFGALPPRITFAEMTEEKADDPKERAADGYNAEGSFMHFSCLALDLGL
jgi:hypothetical protein